MGVIPTSPTLIGVSSFAPGFQRPANCTGDPTGPSKRNSSVEKGSPSKDEDTGPDNGKSLESPYARIVDHVQSQKRRQIEQQKPDSKPSVETARKQRKAEPDRMISHEDHHHGWMRVDLDELPHGLKALLTYLLALTKGKFLEEFTTESKQALSKPLDWLAAQTIQSTRLDIALGFTMAGATLPFSVLAWVAGWLEFCESREKSENLNNRIDQILANTTSLNPAGKTKRSEAVVKLAAIRDQSISEIRNALSLNRYDMSIAFCTMGSGAAITLKVLLDAGLQVASMVNVQSGIGSLVASVGGGLSVFGLSLLASWLALGLGIGFTVKTLKVLLNLKSDFQLINNKSTVAGLRDNFGSDLIAKTYQAFVDQKFVSRQRFNKKFLGWNCGFLAGTTLYAASTTTKVVLGAGVLVGFAGVLASPVGIAALTIIGVVGGVVMVVCSWQFIKWHGKSKKHDAYQIQESPHLGTQFDALQTLYQHTAQIDDTARPTQLRACLFDFVSERESRRQIFLLTVAVNSGKFHSWKRHTYAGNAKRLENISKKRQRYKNLLACISYVGTYLGNLFSGSGHKAAATAAKSAYSDRADNLTALDLEHWLAADSLQGGIEQRVLIAGILRDQQKFLEEKLSAYNDFSNYFQQEGTTSLNLVAMLAEANQEHTNDKALLATIKALQCLLDDKNQSLDFSSLKKAYLKTQGVEVGEGGVDAALAQYLLTGLSDELKATRGILFHRHRAAFHLQEKYRSEKNVADQFEKIAA